MDEKIILASASPRRRELLGMVVKDFVVLPSTVEEAVPEGFCVFEVPEHLARIKAEDISKNNPDAIVIGADTSVILGNTILGKPKTKEQARSMLGELSGKKHYVITGCAIIKNGLCSSFSVRTQVEFYELGEGEIEQYINTEEPYDKAGGYGIQSLGGLFVKRIDGDFFNVVGLPVAELNRKLKEIK